MLKRCIFESKCLAGLVPIVIGLVSAKTLHTFVQMASVPGSAKTLHSLVQMVSGC